MIITIIVNKEKLIFTPLPALCVFVLLLLFISQSIFLCFLHVFEFFLYFNVPFKSYKAANSSGQLGK